MSENSPSRLSRVPTLAPSSPRRQPLALRSNAEANISSIRLVSDEALDVYAKSPFPSHPAHHLPPGRLSPTRYAPFVDKDDPVSDENTPTNRSSIKLPKHETTVLRQLHSRSSNRVSSATSFSDVDTSVLTTTTLTTNDTLLTTPSASRQSSRVTPPSSPIEESYYDDASLKLGSVHASNAIGSTNSNLDPRSTIRAIAPSPSKERLPLFPKESQESLASSSPSTATLPARADDHSQPNSPSSANFEVYPHTSSEAPNFEVYPRTSSDSANFEVYPHTSSDAANSEIYQPTSSNASLPEEQENELNSSPPPSVQSRAIHNYASIESFVLSDTHPPTSPDRPRSASSPARPISTASTIGPLDTEVRAQFPTVRPPSASGSWAEVSSPASHTTTTRMRDDPYRPLPWSSRLSTIASESDRSNSHTTSTESGRRKGRRRTIGSLASGDHVSSFSEARSSEWEYGSGVLTGTESNISIPIPQPLFSPRPLAPVPDESYVQGQGRDSDERDDVLGELQPHYLRSQRSGNLTRYSSKSSLRPSSSDSTKSRSSQISFIGELFWARRYYSNGEPANMIPRNNSFVSISSGTQRIQTATSGVTGSPTSETIPSHLWRPRNRPRKAGEQSDRPLRQETRRIDRSQRLRHTSAITEASEFSEEGPRGRRRSLSTPELSVHEMMYSPHLRRDRRQVLRYSAWAAPSFDEPFSKAVFSPTNRQVLCFATGFILPPAWWIASFLPLPHRPDRENIAEMSMVADSTTHVHSISPSEFSIEEKRWQKAHWWRRINRILSVFGLLLVGAIIALVVVGTRNNGFRTGPSANNLVTVPLTQGGAGGSGG